ncbi:hypothetical protein LTR36_003253 [Oleoguttula mirabilis]|uniref:beta-glucosidase n=1 Tax=Oleoguttula mirabilis TaxID=1507867 RepID=A0AAV9JYY9_9PEZI|nr:hypothetical protein LTR36_003253 [Oleoguttula mirabilis]
MLQRLTTTALTAGSLAQQGSAITTLPASEPWSAASAKAAALVSIMNLFEMNNITVGCAVSASTVATGSACSGVSGSVPGLGYPGMYFQDAGNGVCGQDGVSAFASGVPVGASWVMDLAYERGLYMGAEFERKSGNVALGPVVGLIGEIAET